MALVIGVTKVSVSEQMDKLWTIVLNLACTEDAVEVINRNFSVKYKLGQDIDNKRAEFLERMQDTIDAYIGEQAVFDHAKMDSLVTYLETNLME